MRVPRSVHSSGVDFNMTPMIDVVFLLIIFFLVSSHLAKQEIQVDLDLPTAQSGEELPPQRNLVTVNVQPDGEWLWGSRSVNSAELTGLLEKRKAAVGEDLVVRIRGDRTVTYRTFEPLLRTCAKAGIREVRFAVLPAAENLR